MLASHGHFERLSHGLVEIADEHGFLCFLARQEYAPSGTMDRGGWQAQPLWSRQLGATRPVAETGMKHSYSTMVFVAASTSERDFLQG